MLGYKNKSEIVCRFYLYLLNWCNIVGLKGQINFNDGGYYGTKKQFKDR